MAKSTRKPARKAATTKAARKPVRKPATKAVAPPAPKARPKPAWKPSKLPVKPGVCIPWEQRVKEYPQILGDANVVHRVWDQIDNLAYLYIWAHLIQW